MVRIKKMKEDKELLHSELTRLPSKNLGNPFVLLNPREKNKFFILTILPSCYFFPIFELFSVYTNNPKFDRNRLLVQLQNCSALDFPAS